MPRLTPSAIRAATPTRTFTRADEKLRRRTRLERKALQKSRSRAANVTYRGI